MREVAVVGVGMTKFGRSEKTILEMFSEAALEAIADSNLQVKDIQALFFGTVYGGFAEGQMNMASFAAHALGAHNIPAVRYEGACATASVAIREAFIWVASGFYDIVLAGGSERTLVMDTSYSTRLYEMGSHHAYECPTGITFPGVFALMANLYASKYGIAPEKLKEQMALVAIKNHHNAMFNPKAQFHKEITLEDVYNSPMVASPLQLYDCCPFTDGAAAVVLAPAEMARKLVAKPIRIAGIGQASAGPLYAQKDITRIKARELAAKQAYDMAGLTPKDIDVVELHDCFTIAEIVASECLGLFDFGEASAAVARGETQLKGRIPINPSGGLKAKGHPIGATGAAQVYEIVKQLRGEAGERQVEGAKVGLTDTLGGDLATVANIILRK
ncbi:MAG TPA: thiolase domain-containing protein [Dehalococcoidia bacterium]|nr:thiolase domain-containing protein [Dehalococcoidia bacterium]